MAGPATPLAFAAAPRRPGRRGRLRNAVPARHRGARRRPAADARQPGPARGPGAEGARRSPPTASSARRPTARCGATRPAPGCRSTGSSDRSPGRRCSSPAVAGLERPAAGEAAPRARAARGRAAPRHAGKRPHAGAVRANGDERAPAAPQDAPASGGQAEGSDPTGGQTDQLRGRRGPAALDAGEHGLRLVDGELARQRDGHLRVRTALGTQPRRSWTSPRRPARRSARPPAGASPSPARRAATATSSASRTTAGSPRATRTCRASR